MLFAVRFTDHPEHIGRRRASLAAHIQWLAQHRGTILVAGSLRGAPEADPVGGLWVVEAPSREAVEALIAQDPFTTVGLRQGWEIWHWSKAFEDQVLV